MTIQTQDIKKTISYQLVEDEAREFSIKYQNTFYVIYINNTLFVSLRKEEGTILSVWNLGNPINF